MTQPHRPLRTWLKPPDLDPAIRDGWQVVSADHGPGHRWPRYAMVVATAALALALLWPAPTPPISVVQVPASAVVPRVLNLPDGSQLVVMPGALLEPLDTPSGWRFSVVQGQVAFSITPRTADTPFIVQAGDTEVRVVGTRFAVTNDNGAVQVAVEHGRVQVITPDKSRQLGAGQRWSTPQPPDLAVVGPEPAATEVAEAPVDSATMPARVRKKSRRRITQKAPVLAAPEPKAMSVADLMRIADRQRADQHPAEAQKTLQTVLREHASDPRAGMAALLLARIELENLSQPRRAAGHLREALKLGVPKSLEQIVRGRIVEAWVAVGDRDAARVAAREYLKLHPAGQRAAEIKRWAR